MDITKEEVVVYTQSMYRIHSEIFVAGFKAYFMLEQKQNWDN